jgi:hypothetical protein
MMGAAHAGRMRSAANFRPGTGNIVIAASGL